MEEMPHLADTSTQRAKRAILAQNDLTNSALERIIRNTAGNDKFKEHYSDADP